MKQQDAPDMTRTSNRGSIIPFALACASAAFALALAVTLGACSGESSSDDGGSGGSGSGGTGGNGLPNPCSLATPAELGPIVNITLTRSEEIRGLSGDPSCTWYDADNNGVFQLSLWSGRTQYDFSEMEAGSVPVSGVGAEAHLGRLSTVHVLLSNGKAIQAQALKPVADGNVSSEVQSAASADMMAMVLRYEAAYRFAKLVINEL